MFARLVLLSNPISPLARSVLMGSIVSTPFSWYVLMLSTNKSKLGNTPPLLVISNPWAVYLPSQSLLLWVFTSNLSCLTPNTLSYIKSLNAVLLLNVTACSTNSVCSTQPNIGFSEGDVISIVLSFLKILQSFIDIKFPLLSTNAYCSFTVFFTSAILPETLWNFKVLAIGLNVILSFALWSSVDQNKNRLPANSQSFTSPMLLSNSPKSYPIDFWCLPILISKSKTSATLSYCLL